MATTLIPVELANGLVQMIREDESYNVSYAPVLELNTIDVDDISGDVIVFEVRSNRRTILRVDQLLLDNGAFTNYADVQAAYDDCYDVIQSALSGLGGGGVGAADFTDLGDTFASYTGKGGKGLRVKADESGIEEYDINLPQTVAQAQIADGTYVPGSHITITDPQSGDCTCSATFLVKADGYISSTGWGTFLNAAMSAAVPVKIEYILAIDKIISVYAYETDVLVTSWYNVTGITSWPFDSTTIKATTVIDPVTLTVNVAAITYAATFEGYNTITILAGATFNGYAGVETTITLGGTSELRATIGNNAGVVLTGTQSLTWFKIDDGVLVDLSDKIRTDYSATNGYVTLLESSLVFRQADLPGTDALDMSINNGILDCTHFKCGGTIILLSDGAQKLLEITNYDTGRKYKIMPDIAASLDLTIAPVPSTGANIYLETGFDLVLKGAAVPLDYIELVSCVDDPSKMVQCGGANYVIS